MMETKKFSECFCCNFNLNQSLLYAAIFCVCNPKTFLALFVLLGCKVNEIVSWKSLVVFLFFAVCRFLFVGSLSALRECSIFWIWIQTSTSLNRIGLKVEVMVFEVQLDFGFDLVRSPIGLRFALVRSRELEPREHEFFVWNWHCVNFRCECVRRQCRYSWLLRSGSRRSRDTDIDAHTKQSGREIRRLLPQQFFFSTWSLREKYCQKLLSFSGWWWISSSSESDSVDQR